jgi:hypothetical protein
MRLTSMLCARIRLARIQLARAICASFGGLVCLAGNVQGQCDEASQRFYLPSLQTLIMMPLSQAGDRLETHWASHWKSSKPTSIGVPRVQCDALDEPMRWEQSSGVRPSYVLQDRAILADSSSANPFSGRGVLDADSKSETLTVLAREPVSDLGKQPEESSASAVRFASGSSTVRVTGGSDSRSGEIRERHQQRKRADNFGPKHSGQR